MENETLVSPENQNEIPQQIVIILLETILSGEDKGYSSFKKFCDSKTDNQGKLLFGAPGTPLRQGKWAAWETAGHLLRFALFIRKLTAISHSWLSYSAEARVFCQTSALCGFLLVIATKTTNVD